MKAKIIQIGNSKGIRLPKPVIDQCEFEDEVELQVHHHTVVLRSVARPRAGWEEAFGEMTERSDDELLDGNLEVQSSWDDQEWQW